MTCTEHLSCRAFRMSKVQAEYIDWDTGFKDNTGCHIGILWCNKVQNVTNNLDKNNSDSLKQGLKSINKCHWLVLQLDSLANETSDTSADDNDSLGLLEITSFRFGFKFYRSKYTLNTVPINNSSLLQIGKRNVGCARPVVLNQGGISGFLGPLIIAAYWIVNQKLLNKIADL